MTNTKAMIMRSTLTTRTNLDDIKTMIWQYVHKSISSTLISFLCQRFYRYHEHLHHKAVVETTKSVILPTSYWDIFKKCAPQVNKQKHKTKLKHKKNKNTKVNKNTKQNKNTRQVYFLPEYIRVLFKSYGRIQNPKNTNTDLVLFNVYSI